MPKRILHSITVAERPDVIVETIHGSMTYIDWLTAVEIPRIRRRTDWDIGIHTNKLTGKISLVHYVRAS